MLQNFAIPLYELQLLWIHSTRNPGEICTLNGSHWTSENLFYRRSGNKKEINANKSDILSKQKKL